MGAAWPNLSHGGGALLLLPGKSSFYELSVSSRLPQYCDESILIEQSARSSVIININKGKLKLKLLYYSFSFR